MAKLTTVRAVGSSEKEWPPRGGKLHTDLRRLYKEHFVGLQQVVYRYVSGLEAEQVIHDVFVELLERPDLQVTLKKQDGLTQLKGLVRNRARNLQRSERRARRYEQRYMEILAWGASGQDDLEAQVALEEIFQQAEERLPVKYRAFFVLHYRQQRPIKEVAQRLNKSSSTLRGWSKRCRAVLAKVIQDWLVDLSLRPEL